jgi:hypothetical protein
MFEMTEDASSQRKLFPSRDGAMVSVTRAGWRRTGRRITTCAGGVGLLDMHVLGSDYIASFLRGGSRGGPDQELTHRPTSIPVHGCNKVGRLPSYGSTGGLRRITEGRDMATAHRTGTFAMALIATVIAACAAPGGTAVPGSPSPSTIVGPTASPASPSPMPTAVSSPSPSPSPAAVSWFPWLPPIDTSVDAAFDVDTFVSGRVDVVPVSETPGGPPYRFDTGDPDPSTHPLLGFPRDGLLVVLHGPIVVDDVQWYLLTPAQLSVDIPTGWSPAWTRDGTAYLEHRGVTCPASPTTTAALAKLMLTDGLPACYGASEVTIVGDLGCDAAADPFVTGATWLARGICRFEAPPTVYGLSPDLAPGRYAVTGHFMDREARDCRSADGDESSLGRLVAVLHCRRAFVATSAEPS